MSRHRRWSWVSTLMFIACIILALLPAVANGESGTSVTTEIKGSGLLASERPLAIGSYDQIRPALAYNSARDEFLMVWESARTSGSLTFSTVYGQRISPAGEPLGQAVQVSSDSQTSYRPDVAYNNLRDEYVVVFHDYVGGGPGDILARRVSSDAQVIGVPYVICDAGFSQNTPSIAYNTADGTYFVAWSDRRNGHVEEEEDIYGVKLDANGAPTGVDEAICRASSSQNCVEVIYDPGAGQYMVAWADYRNERFPDYGDIYGRWVSSAGSTAGSEILISDARLSQRAPSLAAVPGQESCMALWQDNRTGVGADIFSHAIGRNGLQGPEQTVSGEIAEQHEPALAYDQTGRFLAVWQDTRKTFDKPAPKPYDIYGRCLDQDGAPSGSDFVLCNATGDQSYPAVAFGSDSYLVVWQDARGSDYDIYGASVTSCVITPTPTETPTPTDTLTPTGTPTSTDTPTPIVTPTPTDEPGPDIPPEDLIYHNGVLADEGYYCNQADLFAGVRFTVDSPVAVSQVSAYLFETDGVPGPLSLLASLPVQVRILDEAWNVVWERREIVGSGPDWFKFDVGGSVRLSGDFYVAVTWPHGSNEGMVGIGADTGSDEFPGRNYLGSWQDESPPSALQADQHKIPGSHLMIQAAVVPMGLSEITYDDSSDENRVLDDPGRKIAVSYDTDPHAQGPITHIKCMLWSPEPKGIRLSVLDAEQSLLFQSPVLAPPVPLWDECWFVYEIPESDRPVPKGTYYVAIEWDSPAAEGDKSTRVGLDTDNPSGRTYADNGNGLESYTGANAMLRAWRERQP